MRTIIALLLMTGSVFAQTVSNINNATVNMQGANQNVSITQTGTGHSATVDLRGNNVSFIGSQNSSSPQSYSFSVDCGTSCPTSPYTITQY
jgi:hypothetical protein